MDVDFDLLATLDYSGLLLEFASILGYVRLDVLVEMICLLDYALPLAALFSFHFIQRHIVSFHLNSR